MRHCRTGFLTLACGSYWRPPCAHASRPLLHTTWLTACMHPGRKAPLHHLAHLQACSVRACAPAECLDSLTKVVCSAPCRLTLSKQAIHAHSLRAPIRRPCWNTTFPHPAMPHPSRPSTSPGPDSSRCGLRQRTQHVRRHARHGCTHTGSGLRMVLRL